MELVSLVSIVWISRQQRRRRASPPRAIRPFHRLALPLLLWCRLLCVVFARPRLAIMAIMPSSPPTTDMSSPDQYAQQDLSWLNALPSQPAFASSSASTSAPGPTGHLALRGSDAIVALDGQLRIFSLSALKHADSNTASEYKVLSNPLIDEALAQEHALALNPLKTLLVISSATSLVLVILPRTTSLASDAPQIPVKAHKVGGFYHNARSPRAEHIIQVKWHPWSKRGTSLLVLASNGSFEEYDVARDLHEPQQTVQLLPQQATPQPRSRVTRSRSRTAMSPTPGLEADAEPEHRAASFSLAISSDVEAASWTPLTVYVLTVDGQVFAAAPFIPRYARIPSSFLHSLAAYAQPSSSTRPSSRQRDVALRYVSHLLKQARHYQATKAAEETQDSLFSRRSRATTPADVLARGSTPGYGGMAKSQSLMSLDPPTAAEANAGGEDELNETVEVQCPDHPVVPGPAVPQGPFVLQPTPQPLESARESRGSDIVYRRSNSLDLLLISNTDGSVNVAVLNVAGKIVPRWQLNSPAQQRGGSTFDSRMPWEAGNVSTRTSRDSRASARRSGRFGLDDSSEDEEEDSEEEDDDETAGDLSVDDAGSSGSPTLFVYESLDLNLPDASPLRFTLDPVYEDTFYIHHNFGVHMVCISAWDYAFAGLLVKEDATALQRFLHSGISSDLRCIVRIQGVTQHRPESRRIVSSVEVIDDVYLGYSVLVMMGDGECLGLEMSLRAATQRESVDIASASAAQPAIPEGATSQRQLYTSLLGAEPFVPPAPFNGATAATFPTIRLKTSDPQAAKREIQVTPDSLRLLGTTVQDLRGQVREVVQGGNAIQRRLELQMKELQRQISKLNDMRLRIEKFQGSGGDRERIAKVGERQRKLIERVDRVLQKTMDSSDSGVSQYEEAWIKEMAGMEKGIGKDAGEGLRGKVNKLQGQLEYLKPDLALLASGGGGDASGTSDGRMGTRQLDKILAALSVESDKLVEAKDKVHRLNRSLPRERAAR